MYIVCIMYMYLYVLCTQGALIGLATGLVFSFVLGLGGPKTPVHNLPTYTNGCSSDSFRDFDLNASPTATLLSTSTTTLE